MKTMKKFSCFIVLALVICLCACSTSNLDELLELGAKYLDEQNYEEAIITFEKAIEIDEKCARAYIGLADAYICTEEYDKAEEILKKGYELTGDEKLKKMLNELKNSGYGIVTEDFLRMEELTIGGRPFYEMTIQDARKAVPNEGDAASGEISVIEGGKEYGPDKKSSNYFGYFSILEESGVGHINNVTYRFNLNGSEEEFFQPEFRNIKGGQTFDTVLGSLGFTKEGVELVRKSCDENDTDKNPTLEPRFRFTRKNEERNAVESVVIHTSSYDNKKKKSVRINFIQSEYTVLISLDFEEESLCFVQLVD